ncbi:hypothetical protein ABT392_04615 [Paucibacter sp. JuS9]|uniref:hypothetical protein n=1 Tax=Roseateles TaxID=93681 RepID=UPI002FE63E3C
MTQRIHHRLVALGTVAALLLAPGVGRAESCYQVSDADGRFANVDPQLGFPAEVEASYVEAMNKSMRTRARCYKKALERDTDRSKERQVVQFGIAVNADGSVGRVSVLKSDFNDGMLLACLGEMVCGFKLQASGKEQKVVRAFNFGVNNRRPDKLDDFRDARKL